MENKISNGKLPARWGDWLGPFRQGLRDRLFRFLSRVANTDDGRAIQAASLGNLLPRKPKLDGKGLRPQDQPYPGLGTASGSRAAKREDVIFITARFRSGSTLLWNLFRNIDGCTAYYEPFNERRWFDPTSRGTRMDPTHRKVEEYWREYAGLEVLGRYYHERWIDRDLFMDEDSWDPDMKRYVEVLIDRAPGRPILQFNRVDFRLPWFRHHFPRARIVHLYRHPRDQWCSTIGGAMKCPRAISIVAFAEHDHYYLRNWARDLMLHFPFLDESRLTHPYQLFYLIWKLSYLFGRSYAHCSLAFEDLTEDTGDCLAGLLRMVGADRAHLGRLRELIDKPESGKWKRYAEVEWFREQEATCERLLADYFPAPESASGGEQLA
jgi:hypothetical protein